MKRTLAFVFALICSTAVTAAADTKFCLLYTSDAAAAGA